MDYLVWERKNEGNSCMLMPPEGIDRDWELLKGVPRAASFPPAALFRMSNDHKRNIGLPDNLMNLAGLVVIHRRLRLFLEGKSLKNIEHLPVSIINHKGRVASMNYSILHAIVPQDALDLQRSGAKYSPIIPADISSVDELVLDTTRIGPDVRIFRLRSFGFPLIIERSLAQEILQAGFTGTAFIELDRYGK